ncbi:MAG: hypothetical protein ACJ77Z_06555 [Thermoleophilaceae bacterium]|jgi:hypothetical protein
MRAVPKKELKTDEEARSCDICGRTILKGERTEPYLAPGGRRKTVCELCKPRADHEGWIRESAHGDIPAARARPAQRGSFVGRLRGMFESDDAEGPVEPAEEAPPVFADEPAPAPREREPVRERRQARRDNRHIRAVPTTAEVKVERALEMFNESDHPRTIAGIARTLGTPWVHASPDGGAPSEVTIVVAWELSWYRYRVDLGDEHEPILLVEKGDELGELEEPLRAWNAIADDSGRLGADVV